jgi:glycosyltransferase involved in cell wall biosynthesis
MNPDIQPLCEVRVPTFQRPKLLKRALLSLTEQTYSNWRCVVFDDCPDRSARSVVENVHDHRIGYSPNTERLGALGNIDQSFAKEPLLGGRYAFVLEDDNYLLPDHITKAIRILEDNGTEVAFCNQYCEVIARAGDPGLIGNEQTLNWMYEFGPNDPNDLLPALLFSHGFSNGAVFWRTDCQSNFRIGALTSCAGIQESLRLLRLKDAAYVSLESTSVWRPREPESKLWRDKLNIRNLYRAIANKLREWRTERERIDCQAVALGRIGIDNVLSFVSNNQISDFARFKADRLLTVERSLLLSGYNVRLTHRGSVHRLGFLLTGYIARNVIKSKLQRAMSRQAALSVALAVMGFCSYAWHCT